MLTICLLVSGGLGQKILEHLYNSDHKVSVVLTDKKSKGIRTFCAAHNILCFAGNPRGQKTELILSNLSCDILLSVNYLFIIEKDLINFPSKYAINIHGSLLPKYRGRTPHVWAIINGEKEAGITAHLIDEEVDNGAILKQFVVPIHAEDTGGNIVEKYTDLYPKMVDQILEDVSKDEVELVNQDSDKASYFGKRTPSSGLINWGWSRERIRNWVRAQANPYPGAFTFLGEEKITIHKMVSSDFGFHCDDPNGKILNVDEGIIVVKTPNGAVQISELEYKPSIKISKGDILQ